MPPREQLVGRRASRWYDCVLNRTLTGQRALIVLFRPKSRDKLLDHGPMSRFQSDRGRSRSANTTWESIAEVHRPDTDHELQEALHRSHFNSCDIGRQFQFQVQPMSFQNERLRRHASTAVKHPKRWNQPETTELLLAAILRPSLRTIYTIIFNISGPSQTERARDFQPKRTPV